MSHRKAAYHRVHSKPARFAVWLTQSLFTSRKESYLLRLSHLSGLELTFAKYQRQEKCGWHFRFPRLYLYMSLADFIGEGLGSIILWIAKCATKTVLWIADMREKTFVSRAMAVINGVDCSVYTFSNCTSLRFNGRSHIATVFWRVSSQTDKEWATSDWRLTTDQQARHLRHKIVFFERQKIQAIQTV